jgi:type I restriction enzyme, S subunit
MSKIWPVVRLEEGVRHRKEFITIDDLTPYKRARVQLHAQGIVLRDEVEGAAIKTKKQQVCRAGEFLVAEIDAKVGGFGIVPDLLSGAVVSSHYFLFEVDESKLDRRFLDSYIRTRLFRDQVEAQGSTNYAAIRPSHVLGYEIPLPSLAEQGRVVARIEQLAGQIHEAQRLRKEAAEEAEAMVASETNAIFTCDEANSWHKLNLEEIAEIRAGVTLGRRLTGDIVRLPYLRVANVQDGYLDLKEVKEIEVLASEIEKWALQNGDILLTEGGDWNKLGRGSVWRGDIANCIHQNHVFRVRALPKTVLPEFLAKQISSPVGKAYFQSASKQTTNLASINQRQLKAFPVLSPPIPEQRRIVAELDALQTEVEALKRLQAATSLELDTLLPSILDRAFKGEL